ncbi:thiamine pyrophosphate-dependent dehydrogenase E1 component subunit alpha [Luminiphilus sp.]|nr:thiamine pyrophosphate-dependent dehydrogenase E1 component subunit alpha [Luminiphilus sp.]
MKNFRILEMMLTIRLVEEEISKRYSEDEMRCPTHLSIGQEAVAAALSQNLSPYDLAVSTHRSHAHYLAKGGDLARMIAEIYGKATGCSKGKGGSMHLVDIGAGFMGSSAIVGNSIPVGVGLGMALKLEGVKNISVVFLGDGATEQGVFFESLNFAALKNLPILFVCENNAYSVYTSKKDRQPINRSIAKVSTAMGVKGTELDGNDASLLDEALGNIISTIKSGLGPQLVECFTYRLREHCGPNNDDSLKYRPNAEIENWLANDPIQKFVDTHSITQNTLTEMENRIRATIDDAFKFAKKSPFPARVEAYSGEYSS